MSATVPAPARHRIRRRAALAATLCAAVALGATACGPFGDAEPKASGPFGELTGPQIVDKAIATTKTAKSLSMDLDLKTTDGPIKAFVSTDLQGRCAGTMTIDTTGTAELIRPDDKAVYLRYDEAFLKEQSKGESPEVQAAVLKQMKGRWLKTDAKDPDTKDMVELCDLKALLADFEQDTAGTVQGEETMVGGKKALTLTQTYKGGEKDTFYVATEGKPYLLKIVTTGGKEPGTIALSGYDKPVTATAPAKKDVLDEKDLG
ncbi:hypothetical protein KV205_32110 [Streptomyces sp. SKN60]|uniref:hypothetical protein n=1 Tax=Streptomyces sp. SKN60 TaxID=2855506 RepID=UPI0022485FF3|nr:hypothetical protein [Streptomyces sp. SKN60]MCX2185120.1 hypothetical protein [Streptomyces sp. SKN60]